jgi:hypothetical protein
MPSVRLISKLGVRRFGLLLPGLALLALVSGIAGFRISEAMGLAELQQTGRHRLDLYGASLEREIDKYAYFPATLGLLWCTEAKEHRFLPGSLIIRRRGRIPGVRGRAFG